MTTATTTSLGEIKLAGDIAGSNNGLAPQLTSTAVTPGSYTFPVMTVDAKGRVTSISNGTSSNLTSILPVATGSVLGGVKIGANITIGGAGSDTISVPIATSSVKGIAKFSSTDFTVTAGNVAINSTSSLPIASASLRGGIKVGSGLSVDSFGVLDAVVATASVKGIASIGSGLTATSGIISLSSPLTAATNSVAGAVLSANTSNITITSGAIDVGTNVSKKDTANTYTKAQVVSLVSPTFAATVTLDLSLGNVFAFTATSNFTLANPTNIVPGGVYHIVVTQDATGSRLISWGTSFKFQGAAQALSTAANARDVITVVAVTSTFLLTQVQRGFV